MHNNIELTAFSQVASIIVYILVITNSPGTSIKDVVIIMFVRALRFMRLLKIARQSYRITAFSSNRYKKEGFNLDLTVRVTFFLLPFMCVN